MKGSTYYPQLHLRWHEDPRSCPHFNDHACAACDHDSYYRDQITRLSEDETPIGAADCPDDAIGWPS